MSPCCWKNFHQQQLIHVGAITVSGKGDGDLVTFALDELDKKIIQYLSVGTSSYEELARQCNVTRNTVYRRLSVLKNKGIIKNTLNCTVNFDQIDITVATIGVSIPQNNQDKAINLLATNGNVKFLWRTYGTHNITLVAFCEKGREGEIIQDIKGTLEELNAKHICVSVGYVWEKMDNSPFEEQIKLEEKITQIIADVQTPYNARTNRR